LIKPFFDLSSRVKLRVTGADRERFLNGQLTNDVHKATETNAIEACALNAKGKMTAHLFFTVDGDVFLIDADPVQRESLLSRFERYIIADDVQIESATDQFSIFHSLGEMRPVLPDEFKIRLSNRFAEPGHDIWSAAERHDELLDELARQFRFCDDDCAEVLRVERGIPRWNHELTEEIIPIEANLEARTIDYEKGCYIGQEVVSRMKMSGQTNKRLCGLAGAELERGMKLTGPEPGAREAGWITSAVNSERLGKKIALGFVKRGFNSPGTKLRAFDPARPQRSVSAEVVELPFAG
jgi:tRNA-modifying protein YgfZ